MNNQFEFSYVTTPTTYIYTKWNGMVDQDEFRQGMNLIIDLMKKHETGKILSNTVALGALSEEDQQWSVEDWLTRALAVGYTAVAIVISEDIFGQMAVEDILTNVSEKSPIKIQYFDDEEKAAEWLATLES